MGQTSQLPSSVAGTVPEAANATCAPFHPSPTLDVLDHPRLAAGGQTRQQEELEAAGPAYANSNYICADELGVPLHPEAWSDGFARICREAQLPKIRLHDTRATMNAILERAGVPDTLRAAWLGHTVVVNRQAYLPKPKDLTPVSDVIAPVFAAFSSAA